MHVVITPSRNEASHLEKLVESMKNQTHRPIMWVILDDNSSDGTKGILDGYLKEISWMKVIHISDDSPRKRGAHIAKLFNTGLSSIDLSWSFCSKIDADMILPKNYFEKLFTKFDENDKLGIASGSCFFYRNRKRIVEKVTNDHTRGGLKTYRRQCFDDIDGVREVDGWDGIDNIMAQMKGWETSNFNSIPVHHQRPTGTYFGVISGCFEAGQFAYSMRYFFPFLVARSIDRMSRRPIFLGGLALFFGYISAFLARRTSIGDKQAIHFLRKKQKSRILSLGKK